MLGMNRLNHLLTWGRKVVFCTATSTGCLASVLAAAVVSISTLPPAPAMTIKPTRDLIQKTLGPWPLLVSIIIIALPAIAPDNSIRGAKRGRRQVSINHNVTTCHAVLPRKIMPWNLVISHELLTWKVIERQVFNGIDMNENLKHMRLLYSPGPHKVYLHTAPLRL
jgi:hypothetical protein